jgi:hypothetical protein
MGVRTGTYFMLVSIGGLTGSPIGGALLSQDNGGYLYLQLFCGLTMAAGVLTYIAARWTQVRFKLLTVV